MFNRTSNSWVAIVFDMTLWTPFASTSCCHEIIPSKIIETKESIITRFQICIFSLCIHSLDSMFLICNRLYKSIPEVGFGLSKDSFQIIPLAAPSWESFDPSNDVTPIRFHHRYHSGLFNPKCEYYNH